MYCTGGHGESLFGFSNMKLISGYITHCWTVGSAAAETWEIATSFCSRTVASSGHSLSQLIGIFQAARRLP